MTDHPTAEMLDRLLAGSSTSEESSWALAHLVHCETCSRYVRAALARTGNRPDGPDSDDQAHASSLARSVAGIAGIRAAELDRLDARARSDKTYGPDITNPLNRTLGVSESVVVRSDPRETQALPASHYELILDALGEPERLEAAPETPRPGHLIFRVGRDPRADAEPRRCRSPTEAATTASDLAGRPCGRCRLRPPAEGRDVPRSTTSI